MDSNQCPLPNTAPDSDATSVNATPANEAANSAPENNANDAKQRKAKRKVPKPTDKTFLVDFDTLVAELQLPRKFLLRLYRAGAFPCITAGRRPFFRLAEVREQIERLAEEHNQYGELPKLP